MTTDVNVQFGDLTSGRITVGYEDGRYYTPAMGLIPFPHPALAGRVASREPALGIHVRDDVVTGMVGTVSTVPTIGAPGQGLLSTAGLLAWEGLNDLRTPHITSELARGNIDIRATDMAFRLSDTYDGTGSFYLQTSASPTAWTQYAGSCG